ncbi:MAG: ubiquinol-cytochrome c reductase iron-sulfur subunit [Dehalococcoidia bacterium]
MVEEQEPQDDAVTEAAPAADGDGQSRPAPAVPPPAAPAVVEAQKVDTPIARPVPRRGTITRRVLILGGFWSTLGLALLGMIGSPLDFAWTRNPAGAAADVVVSPDRIPAPGADPIIIPEGRFFLLNLEAGVTPNGEETPGGLLALWRKCPHLGCSVPYRADFTFLGRTGWFRCPCHGSTYTKEGGVLVFGPAPRPLDRFDIQVQEDGSIVVTTGVTASITGTAENPGFTTPYSAPA